MTLNKNAMLRCYPVTPFSKSHAVTLSHCHAPKIQKSDTPIRLNTNVTLKRYLGQKRKTQKTRRHGDTPKWIYSSILLPRCATKNLARPKRDTYF